MREIKFKYYFLLNKVVINTKIFIMEDIEDINFNTILFLNVDCNKDNFENMELYRSEYIGLKDKNGVEVYHNDIGKDKFSKNVIVEWCEEHLCYGLLTIDEIVKDEWNFCLKDLNEVIGNIYENKELLNENK